MLWGNVIAKTRSTGVIAAIVMLQSVIGMPMLSAASQSTSLEGCLAGGVAPSPDYFLPNLTNGFLVISDERRNDEQLAATFADPADALSRLHAYCWVSQAERVYRRNDLIVDVSVHHFLRSEGATLAQDWFSYQRARDLDLNHEIRTRDQIQTAIPQMNIGGLDKVFIRDFVSDTEYTLYAKWNEYLARVTVSGAPPGGRSREFVAYQVLSLVFPFLDLFQYPHSIP